jgi:hypothetical protein
MALVPAIFHPHPAPVPEIVEDEKRHDHDSEQRQFPVQAKEQDQHAEADDQVAQKIHRRARDQRVHRAGVLVHPGHHAAGLPLLVKAKRELLQVGENGDAQVAGHPHAGVLHEIIAGEQRQGPDGENQRVNKEKRHQRMHPGHVAGQDQVNDPRHPRRLPVIGIIDDPAGERGKGEGKKRDRDDEQEQPGEPPAIGPQKDTGALQRGEHFVAGTFAGHCGYLTLA